MHRCLVDTAQLLSEDLALNKEESRHLKTVLRIKPGDRIELFDGTGLTRLASIDKINKNSISIRACGTPVKHTGPACAITLFVCISKGRRMDWSVEKAVELGASRIIPVISDRTIVRLSETEGVSKAERWRRVAADAARQCGTAWIPEITPPIRFNDSLAMFPECAPVFTAALTKDAMPLRKAMQLYPRTPPTSGWFVGPEGDFTTQELNQLRKCESIFVNLGLNVLRSETATIYGLCVLSSAWL